MNRNYFFTAFFAAMLTLNANAQRRFNEMEYGKIHTVFHLNASSTPPQAPPVQERTGRQTRQDNKDACC